MQENHHDPQGGRAGSGTGWAALGAAAVMLALTLWGRGIALTLAGTLVGPVPALRTAFALSPAGQADSAGSTADSMAASSAAEAVPDTSIEQYLVELTPDDQKPADAGTVIETSYGQGSGEKYRGAEVDSTLLPKVKVEVIVSKIPVDSIIDAATKALYTGHIGDGKIFVYNVAKVVKVRTGEQDYAALQDVE